MKRLTLLSLTLTLSLSSIKTWAADVPAALAPATGPACYYCIPTKEKADKVNSCFDDLKDCHATVKSAPSNTGLPVVVVVILAIVAAGAGYVIGSASK
jgi:hypothetical protein